jgi:ATP-dependent RNA helicase RhlB
VKFSELDLHPTLVAAIQKQNYIECTPVQELAIPVIIEGKDVAGLAQTGTGKTAAFVLPLMERILRARDIENAGKALHGDEAVEAQIRSELGAAGKPAEPNKSETESNGESPLLPIEKRAFVDWQKTNYVLVLVPTRELAEQVYETVQLFGSEAGLRGTAIYGGMAYDKQKKAISHGVEFVVATPGRLIDLYKEHVVDLRQVRAVVFDEADRMFDMGFKEDMKYVLNRIPRDRQLLVFSATLNFDVLNVCYEFGSEPVEINVSKDQPKAENVDDVIFHVGLEDKPRFLLSILKKEVPRQAIVFSNFKRNVERITQFLNRNGIPAVGISSLMTQAQRNRVMAQFKSDNERNILVATDLAARGLDVLGVDIVVNFDLPDDPENYVHRIGRTGRAGAKGLAFSFVGDRDLDALRRIEDYLGHKVEMAWLDDQFLVSEFSPFPLERELSPYPPRMKPFDRKPSGGGPRESRGPRRPDRGRAKRKLDDNPNRNDEGRDRQEGTSPQGRGRMGNEVGTTRGEDKRESRDAGRSQQRRPARPARSAGASAAYRPRTEAESSSATSSTSLAASGGTESHRDRSRGRHASGGREHTQQVGDQTGDAAGRNRNNGSRRHGPGADKRRHQNQGQAQDQRPNQRTQQGRGPQGGSSPRKAHGQQGRGASAPARRATNQQVVAKDSLGKKVSGFFKKIFGGS